MINFIKTKTLLTAGAVAAPLFILVFLIEGATRADYSPLRHPVSSLSIGELGWIQASNFIITGALILAFAVGLRRILHPARWGSLLIGLVGIGLIGAGVFTSDPLNGYPPGSPLVPVENTVHGQLHDIFSAPVFLALPIACFIFTRWFLRKGKRGWAIYSAISGVAMVFFFVLAAMGFSQVSGFADFAGVFQRLSIVSGLGWVSPLAIYFLKTPEGATTR